MYEIVVRIKEVEIVVETVGNIATASHYVSLHRENGYYAFYRPCAM